MSNINDEIANYIIENLKIVVDDNVSYGSTQITVSLILDEVTISRSDILLQTGSDGL